MIDTVVRYTSGEVQAANATGIKLYEEARWLNISKFAEPEDITIPQAGDTVTVGLDDRDFIRTVEITNDALVAMDEDEASDTVVYVDDSVELKLAIIQMTKSFAYAEEPIESVITKAQRLYEWVTS